MGDLLPENTRKENFSRAYVDAIAAAEGFSVSPCMDDFDSVDVTVVATGRVEYGGKTSTGRSPKLDLQLKCTAKHAPKDGVLTFPLPVKNYNDLRDTNRVDPVLLVVLYVPKTWAQRLKWSASSLRLQKIAFWASLRGEGATSNKETVTVTLREHFNPSALRQLMYLRAEGEL